MREDGRMTNGEAQRSGPFVVRLACDAMATRFEFVLVGDDEGRLRAAGEEAVEVVRAWHARLSWFDRGSFVSHVNESAAVGPVRCDAEFFEVLVLCRDVWRASGGAFDPTVAALMRAAGFREGARDDAAVSGAAEARGFDKVELDETARSVRFAREGVGIDLGAIGKGFALDRVRDALLEAGVGCALVHGGTSSVMALGAPPEEQGWRVAVGRGPDAPVAVLRDAALGVSAPHGRTVETEGTVHGHVLDPRTGESAARALLAAVIAPSAALADAWSTALLVEGCRPAGMPGALASFIARGGGADAVWEIVDGAAAGRGGSTYALAPRRAGTRGVSDAGD